MAQFAKYDEQGRVLYVGDVPESMLGLQGERVFIGEIDGEREYIVAGNKQPRPANPAILDGHMLRDLPVPCKVVVNRQEYACTQGSMALELAIPGTHQIAVQAFPFQTASFVIWA